MSYVLRFRNEEFLIHIISHLAKHLKNRGAGVRNLCDIVLYIEANSKNIDWVYVTEKINSFGLKRFFNVLIVILHKHFGMQIGAMGNISISDIAIDNNFADELLQYMLSHGVYGTPFEENLYLPNIKKIHNSKIKMYIDCVHQLFPSIIKLSPRYSYAKKFPILLPLAWIHRLLVIRFERKVTIINAIKEMQSSRFEVNTKNKLLRDLGLL